MSSSLSRIHDNISTVWLRAVTLRFMGATVGAGGRGGGGGREGKWIQASLCLSLAQPKAAATQATSSSTIHGSAAPFTHGECIHAAPRQIHGQAPSAVCRGHSHVCHHMQPAHE